MNYSELFTAVNSYVENNFPTVAGGGTFPAVDTFIKQAEQRIYNSAQLPATKSNQVGTIVGGNKYLTLPTGWLATFSLATIDALGEYLYLLEKDVNFIRASYPGPADLGPPEYYALFDENTLILGPTPNIDYSAELHFFKYPESIVTAATTWLGDNFSSALLYGALLEANTYIKGEDNVDAIYKERYTEAMALLKQLVDGKERRDAYRSGQVRQVVQ